MRVAIILIAALPLFVPVGALAEESSIILAETLEQDLQRYFANPCDSTAKPVLSLIPAGRYSTLSLPNQEAAIRFEELIDNNLTNLSMLIESRNAHAIRVGLALQCFSYDHHVKNALAITLANLAISDLPFLLRQARKIQLSAEVFADTLSCSGVCGYDDDALEKLSARLDSLQKYCKRNSLRYCSLSISCIQQEITNVQEDTKPIIPAD